MLLHVFTPGVHRVGRKTKLLDFLFYFGYVVDIVDLYCDIIISGFAIVRVLDFVGFHVFCFEPFEQVQIHDDACAGNITFLIVLYHHAFNFELILQAFQRSIGGVVDVRFKNQFIFCNVNKRR